VKKVLVIGLDAATFDIIDPLVREGDLPHIHSIIREGVRLPLRTTIPPLSPNAWTSLATGKNAGKHGIYSFTEQRPDSYRIQFVNARSRKARPIWSLLSSAGKRVGVMNMPVTFPPDEVNGFMVSGMDAPGRESGFTFPPGLKDLLLKRFDYVIDYSFLGAVTSQSGKKILDNLYAVEGEFPWDFLFVVLVALDRVQHFFWHCMEPAHPRYNEEGAELFRKAVPDMYRRCDALLGRLLEGLAEEVTVIIVSDHGAGPFDDSVPYLNLNAWLADQGYLRLKGGEVSRSDILAKSRDFLRKNLSSGLKQRLKTFFPGFREKLQSHVYFSPILWSRSRAFATYDEFMARGIRINLKGREPEGIVEPGEEYEKLRDELVSRIADLRHPVTGEPIVEKVYRREELFSGKAFGKAPDLVVEWNEKAFFSPSSRQPEPCVKKRKERFRLTAIPRSGDHRPFGIFLARGPGIRKNTALPEAHIMDVAPTILHLMGEPVPRDMDGRVLDSLFTEDFRKDHPVRFAEAGEGERKEEVLPTYSEVEAKKIEERLRRLGYID